MANVTWKQPARYLFFIGALFTLAMALSMTFLNVFFWKNYQSLSTIALYNGFQFLMIPLVFVLCRKLPWKHFEVYLRTGILVLAFFYGLVLFLKNYANPYILGSLLGMGAGFYWYAFNLLSIRVMHKKQRVKFNSYMGVFNSLSNVIAPLLSGLIISNTTNNSGYFFVFSLSLTFFGVSLLLSFRLHAEPYDIQTAPLFQRKHPNWNRILLGNIFQGIKEGVFYFLPAILVYITTKSELSLGTYSAITAVTSSITFFLLGKFLNKRWYNECMIFGSSVSTAAIGLFMIQMNYRMVLIYGIITAVSFPVFSVPFLTRVFHVIDEAHQTYQQEYIVEREICLNTGRLLSIGSFLIGYDIFPEEWIPVYLLVIGSMQIVAVLIFRKIKLAQKDPSKMFKYENYTYEEEIAQTKKRLKRKLFRLP